MTTETADTYINSRYSAFNPLRVNWTIQTDNDKLVYLNQSFDEIKALPYKCDVPKELLENAISENALAILDKEISARANMQAKTLQSLGQQKSDKTAQVTPKGKLTSEKAYTMLKPYIGFTGAIYDTFNWNTLSGHDYERRI